MMKATNYLRIQAKLNKLKLGANDVLFDALTDIHNQMSHASRHLKTTNELNALILVNDDHLTRTELDERSDTYKQIREIQTDIITSFGSR